MLSAQRASPQPHPKPARSHLPAFAWHPPFPLCPQPPDPRPEPRGPEPTLKPHPRHRFILASCFCSCLCLLQVLRPEGVGRPQCDPRCSSEQLFSASSTLSPSSRRLGPGCPSGLSYGGWEVGPARGEMSGPLLARGLTLELTRFGSPPRGTCRQHHHVCAFLLIQSRLSLRPLPSCCPTPSC